MINNKGFVAPITGILIFVILGIATLGVDLGLAFYNKQKLQKTADASALAGVSDLDNYYILAEELIYKNNPKFDRVKIERGFWNSGQFIKDQNGDAVHVRLERDVPLFFSRIFGKHFISVAGDAVAKRQVAGVVVSAGSGILNLDTKRSLLLNALLGSLLGTNINLDIVSWQGLINSQIDLIKFINLAKLRLNVGNTKELLNTSVSLLDILDILCGITKNEDYTLYLALESLKVQIGSIPATVKLGEIIQIDLNKGAFVSAKISAANLLGMIAQVINSKSTISAGVNVHLPYIANLDLRAKVIEPPVIKVMTEGSTIHTGQVRLYLNTKVLNLPGVLSDGVLHLPLYLELGSADVMLSSFSKDKVIFKINPSLTQAYIGSINPNFFLSNSTIYPNNYDSVNILNILYLVQIKVKAYANAKSSQESQTLSPPFPQSTTVYGALGTTVYELLNTLSNNLDLNVKLLGIGLSLDEVLRIVLNIINNVVIGGVVAPLLDITQPLLGLSIGTADVTVYDYAYKAVLVK